jgi:hypothetical protein
MALLFSEVRSFAQNMQDKETGERSRLSPTPTSLPQSVGAKDQIDTNDGTFNLASFPLQADLARLGTETTVLCGLVFPPEALSPRGNRLLTGT